MKFKIEQHLIPQILELSKTNTILEISKKLNVGRTSLYNLINKNEEFKSNYEFLKNKKNITFSKEQKEIFFGCMLGDSYLEKTRSLKETSRFGLNHSSKQREYFNHKVNIFKDFIIFNSEKNSFDKRTNKTYTKLHARTFECDFFGKYRKLFYNENGIKIINSEILNEITPKGIAYWFMDDGFKRGHFATMCFSEIELCLIQKWFLEKYNIRTIITKYKVIKVINQDLEKFETLIFPYLHPSMYYKLCKIKV